METVEVVLPEHGAYTGAYIDFGEAEDAVTLETIEDFEQMVGKHQAIIASSSYWGEQNFPTANLQHGLASRLPSARLLVAVGPALRAEKGTRPILSQRDSRRRPGIATSMTGLMPHASSITP